MAAVKLHVSFGNLLCSLPAIRHRSHQLIPSSSQLIFTRCVTRRLAKTVGNKKQRGPTITSKISATNRTSSENFAVDDEIPSISNKLAIENLAKYHLQKSSSVVALDSVYQKLPHSKKTVIGENPEPRYLWKEKSWPNGFPESAEEANTDIATYLEQKDIYRRLKVISIPKFCVGSIVAVTRAEPYSPKGSLRFVGICIQKRNSQNTLGASFVLRNVIANEPIEINFEVYSPLIQKIEVLKHEKRTDTQGIEDLTFLRDYPLRDSTVDENMEPVPYTEEPILYQPGFKDNIRIKKWFKQKFRHKCKRKPTS